MRLAKIDGYPIFPAAILIDTQEQHPFCFDGIRSDAKQGGKPWVVCTLRNRLLTGDYTLANHEYAITVERKSLEDLFGTLIPSRSDPDRRDRFEAELGRMATMPYAYVVVEADWRAAFDPPYRLRVGRWQHKSKSVYRSVLSFKQRFPTVQWEFCPSREFAEVHTFHLLRRFLFEEAEKQQPSLVRSYK